MEGASILHLIVYHKEKIYAQAASEAGDILVRKLYFSPLYNLSDEASDRENQRDNIL